VFVVKSTTQQVIESFLKANGYVIWPRSKGYFGTVNWLFVNIEKKQYARGIPGVQVARPCVPHAITLDEIRELEALRGRTNALNTYIKKPTLKYEGLSMLDMNVSQCK